MKSPSRRVSIIKELEIKPCSASEIGKKLNTCKQATRIILRAMHCEGLVHISSYTDKNVRAPIYKLGTGVDVPKPDPYTEDEIKERREQRKLDRENAKRAVPTTKQTWMSLL